MIDSICVVVIVDDFKVGRDPAIHVWDAETLKVLSIMKGQRQRGICALDFTSLYCLHCFS